jgi:hypothetical protein
MNYHKHVFRLLLLLIGIMAFSDLASAQHGSSLVFTDYNGRRVEFTSYGTVVYPDLNIISRGYEVVYGYGYNLRAYYLNESYNSGIVPVSLSTDHPADRPLSYGTKVYIRAVVRTADNRLTITHRYVWWVGNPKIDAIVTVKNNTGYFLPLKQVSIFTPAPARPSGEPSIQASPATPDALIKQADTPIAQSCPCMPVVSFDGSSVDSTTIDIQGTEYVQTTASFPWGPLQSDGSIDVSGCEPMPGQLFGYVC